ncbi:MAG: lipopolysaccharide heptosyltransferase family protein [Rhodanobacteraceae bacterium]|nr:MAG: lipopolysaccharide heptosyltransferase family protein [Rhodanobacteraceae bacterium]
MGGSERMLEPGQYSEWRRRIVRWGMRPLFRATSLRPGPTGRLSDGNIHRILICRPNHRLGNLLLLTPLVTEIQRLFPDADIDIVLAGEHVAELFRAFPNVKHIYNLSRRMVRHPVALARTMLQLRQAHYDLAIDPCETSQSGRLLVGVAKPEHALGPPRDRSAEQPDPTWMQHAPAHMAQWPVHMLRMATQPASPLREYPPLDIRLSTDERQRGRAVLDRMLHAKGKQPGTVVGVFAEATGAKVYGSDWWRRFIRTLQAEHPGAAIVEIAPPDGRPRLAMDLPSFSSPSPREVAAVIANMTCFVSADCGVMHLASASGAPTIGLFSVTEVSKYAPYGRGSRAIDTNGKSPEDVARIMGGLTGLFAVADAPAVREAPSATPDPDSPAR